MQVDTEKQVQVIGKSIEVFKTAPAILKANQERTAKALMVGNSILEQWVAAWEIEDSDKRMEALQAADERSNKFLVNTSKAKGEMNQARAAITQLMTEFSRMFTSSENELDKAKPGSVPASIQDNRDKYVTAIAIEEKRKEIERAEKAAISQARIDFKADVLLQSSEILNNYLFNKKNMITEHFNAITLENFEKKSASLQKMSCILSDAKIKELLSEAEFIKTSQLIADEYDDLTIEAMNDFEIDTYKAVYEVDISETKRLLIDRLPSKKKELEDIKRQADEAEQARIAQLEANRIAEEKRQSEIDAAIGKKKKELEEAARLQKIKDDEAAAEASKKTEDERQLRLQQIKEREEAEALRIKTESEDMQKSSQLSIQMKADGDKTLNLFDSVAEISGNENKAQTKTGVEIKIHHPAAYVQIFQFYFEKEGKNLSILELGRKTLDQMKSFCEKVALKSDEKITGTKLLEYIETYKAVNKKII